MKRNKKFKTVEFRKHNIIYINYKKTYTPKVYKLKINLRKIQIVINLLCNFNCKKIFF